MGSNGFTGQLPSEIGLLTMLTTFDLGNNLLSGSLPEQISRMSSLRFLRLRQSGGEDDMTGKKLMGEIPAGLFDLANLTCFDVSGTLLFSSAIPEEFCDENNDAYVGIPCENEITAACQCCVCNGPDMCAVT